MLPGIRFLFAAVVLSLSLVVFGLGAVSLLRSAHEEFASLPIGRAPPETVFNQRFDNQPRLAMLRVEAPAQPAQPDMPAAVSPNPATVNPVTPPIISGTPPSTSLTGADIALQPDTVASTSTSADASPAPVTDSQTAQSKPSPEPGKVSAAALSPIETTSMVSRPPAAATPVDVAPAVSSQTTAPTDSNASTPATVTAEVTTMTTADKPANPTPAPTVTASIASDQATVVANTTAGPHTATASEPAPPPVSDPAQLAALTDPARTTEDLTPSEPIPTGLVPIPRQRPTAKPTKTVQKKISKPHRVAARVQQPAAVDPLGSPFN